MRGPSNALGQVESSDAHDGHVTRLVSLRSGGALQVFGIGVRQADWEPSSVVGLTV